MPVVKFIPLPQKPHHTSMNCMLKTAMLSISLTTVLQLLPQLLPQLLMDVHQSPFALPLELTQPNALLKSLSVLHQEKPLMHQSSLSKTLLPNAQPLFQSALLPEKLQHHALLPKKLALPPLCD